MLEFSKNEQIKKFLLNLYENDNFDNNILEQYNELYKIYGNENIRHSYSKLLTILFEFDIQEMNITKLGEKLDTLNNSIEKNQDFFKDKENFKKNIQKLHDHISLEIQRIGYMKTIDNKTEKNKEELIENIKEKEKTLKEMIETYDKKIKNIDEETMKKMGMYLSVFTLIAGNIAVLFKGIEVSPLELVGVIFVINSTLLVAIRMLFYFVDKDNRFIREIIIIFLVGNIFGLLSFVFSKCF